MECLAPAFRIRHEIDHRVKMAISSDGSFDFGGIW